MDQQYSLKSKSARGFFSEVMKNHATLPFSIRGFKDLTGAKVGVKECMDHELLCSYPVLTEKAGIFVAQFKATVVVQPKSTAILCGGRALISTPTRKLRMPNFPSLLHLTFGFKRRSRRRKNESVEVTLMSFKL